MMKSSKEGVSFTATVMHQNKNRKAKLSTLRLFKKKDIEKFKRNESSELKDRIVSQFSKKHLMLDNQAGVPI